MSGPGLETRGFFGSLFDFSFTSFVTLRFLKLIYGLIVVLILLTALTVFIAGLVSGEASGVVLALVGVPLATLLYLVLARVSMEIVALFFRIGDDASRVAAAMAPGPAAPPPPRQPTPPYDPPPSYDPTDPYDQANP